MKRPAILYALFLLVLGGGGLLWYRFLVPEPVPGPPEQSATQLAALPDSQLSTAVTMELSRQAYHGELRQKAGWRRLSLPARAIWAVADCEARLSSKGGDLSEIQHGIRTGADIPDFTEVQIGCQEIGLNEAASRMQEINAILADHPNPGPTERSALARLKEAWLAEVGNQAAQQKRLAYIRQHMNELASP